VESLKRGGSGGGEVASSILKRRNRRGPAKGGFGGDGECWKQSLASNREEESRKSRGSCNWLREETKTPSPQEEHLDSTGLVTGARKGHRDREKNEASKSTLVESWWGENFWFSFGGGLVSFGTRWPERQK